MRLVIRNSTLKPQNFMNFEKTSKVNKEVEYHTFLQTF